MGVGGLLSTQFRRDGVGGFTSHPVRLESQRSRDPHCARCPWWCARPGLLTGFSWRPPTTRHWRPRVRISPTDAGRPGLRGPRRGPINPSVLSKVTAQVCSADGVHSRRLGPIATCSRIVRWDPKRVHGPTGLLGRVESLAGSTRVNGAPSPPHQHPVRLGLLARWGRPGQSEQIGRPFHSGLGRGSQARSSLTRTQQKRAKEASSRPRARHSQTRRAPQPARSG
jgi:hypothetical protein